MFYNDKKDGSSSNAKSNGAVNNAANNAGIMNFDLLQPPPLTISIKPVISPSSTINGIDIKTPATSIPRFNIGNSDYKSIVEEEYLLVDKTLFIKEIIDDTRTKVKLIIRPRQFGKSLNMSMLKYFFDSSGEKYDKLFIKKKIWACEDKYKEMQGKYPVIHLSLKQCNKKTLDLSKGHILNDISELYKRHKKTLSKILSDDDKSEYQRIIDSVGTPVEINNALLKLTSYLKAFYGSPVLVLIDEYDTPINAGYLNSYLPEIVQFLRDMLLPLFKDNPNLYQAILTGIFKMEEDSNFFGDKTHFKVYTPLSDTFASYFGFSRDEVADLLEKTKLSDNLLSDMKKWYGGYYSGSIQIFNPWSVANYINQQLVTVTPSPKSGTFTSFWINATDNKLINSSGKDILTNVHIQNIYSAIQSSVRVTIDAILDIKFADIENDLITIMGFLFLNGYLTLKKIKANEAIFMIPNDELLGFYQKHVHKGKKMLSNSKSTDSKFLFGTVKTQDSVNFDDKSNKPKQQGGLNPMLLPPLLPAATAAVASDAKDNDIDAKYFQAIRNNQLPDVASYNQGSLIGPDTRDKEGYTGLQVAIICGHLEIVKHLWDGGRSTRDSGEKSQFYMHLAVLNQHIPIIEFLLSKADANIVMPSLDIECKWDYIPQLQLASSFIKGKLNDDFNFEQKLSLTPPQIAILLGNTTIFDLLFKSFGNRMHQYTGNIQIGNILHLAVFAHQHIMLHHLLTAHQKFTEKLIDDTNTKQGMSPLGFAAYLGNLKAIQLLVEASADATLENSQRKTPLMFAVNGNQFEAVESLSIFLNVKPDAGMRFMQAHYEAKQVNPQFAQQASSTQESKKNKNISDKIVNFLSDAAAITANMANRYRPTDFSRFPLTNLVFRGGGPKGIAYAGAFEALEAVESKASDGQQRKLLSGVLRTAGTSAGAIMALLISLNYSSKDIKAILAGMNINEFVTGVDVAALKQGGAISLLTQLVRAAYKGLSWSDAVFKDPFDAIYKLTGLSSGEEFRKWAEKIILDAVMKEFNQKLPPSLHINEQTGELNLTFGELRKLVVETKRFKHLYVVATQITPIQDIRTFNSESKDDSLDNVIVADAVRASMSIPGLFTPYEVRAKVQQPGGKTIIIPMGQTYVDGGLLMNYPLKVFDKAEFVVTVGPDEKGNDEYNRASLGFNLVDGYHVAIKYPKDLPEYYAQYNHWNSVRKGNYLLFIFNPVNKIWVGVLARDSESLALEKNIPLVSPLLVELNKVNADTIKDFDMWELKKLLRKYPLFNTSSESKKIDNVKDLCGAIAKVFADAELLMANAESKYALRTIDIDNCGVSLFDFDLDEKRQKELIESGNKSAREAKCFQSCVVVEEKHQPSNLVAPSQLSKAALFTPVKAKPSEPKSGDDKKNECSCCCSVM